MKITYNEYIENNTINCDVSYRGGSLKVDISGLLSQKSLEAIEEAGEEATAGAYQNYLGGGIAGSIQTGNNFDPSLLTKVDRKKWDVLKEDLKRYFYNLNNGGGDEYMQENVTGATAGGYEATQRLAKSGY